MTGLPRTLEKSSRAHLSADSLADLALPAHLPQLLSFAACAAPPHTPGLAAPSQATGSPARAFEVGLTSSHDAATRAHTLTFLREAAALLQDMAALLPWTAALDVHCEAQQSLPWQQPTTLEALPPPEPPAEWRLGQVPPSELPQRQPLTEPG